MSEVNAMTIRAYEDGVRQYADATSREVSGSARRWMATALAGLSPEAHVLELGSAFGRDAAYMQSLGYSVLCTDAVIGFVELLQQQGFNAAELNAATDPLGGPYDLILANAVLLHFRREEVPPIINKMPDSLSDVGRIALRLKQGEGEGWEQGKLASPCYFCYWTEPEVDELFNNIGFRTEIDDTVGRSGARWLNVVAYRN